jgi:hypothetical protein
MFHMCLVPVLVAECSGQYFEARNKILAKLSPEESLALQAKWREELVTERRHQEICQAIRDARPKGLFF